MAPGLADLTPLFGSHAYVAGALFEVERQWAANEAEAAVQVHLARFSRYHSWHAELWLDLLPDSVALADLAAANPPDPIWASQLEALSEVAATGPRLALMYRCVLPRVLTATDCLLDALSPVADAAAMRTCGFVGADLAAEQAAGARLLHQLTRGETLADALARAVSADVVLSDSEFGRCGA